MLIIRISARAIPALSAAALAASLSGCHARTAAAADPQAVAAQVKRDAEQLVADYNAKDPAKAAAHDASDYIGMYPGTPNTLGPDADKASMAEQMKDPAVAYRMTGDGAVTVGAGGDLAVYENDYAFTTSDPKAGKPRTEKGTWVAIYRRQGDGAMKLWRSILVAGPAPGS